MLVRAGMVFDGPSVQAPFPAAWVRIERLPAALPDEASLRDAFMRLPDPLSSAVAPQGATSTAGLIAALALELQCLTGAPAARSVISQPGPGTADIAIGFEYGDVATLALQLAAAVVGVAATGDAAALRALDRLGREFAALATQMQWEPAFMAQIRGFRARGIPVKRLHEKLYLAGYGRFRSYLDYAITGNTGAIATWIANDKMLCNRILRPLGLPVTDQAQVGSLEEALRAAQRLGYPVVLKPRGGTNGVDVVVGLDTPAELEAAYRRVARPALRMMVERMVAGSDHRLLVIDGELVAATRRVPGHVVGDGVRTVTALLEEVNRDPRRGAGHRAQLSLLPMDAEADRMLGKAGLSRDGVPARGQVVFLRAAANIARGALSVDVTDLVHPETRDMAVRAAAASGLDLVGIDFITPDIARSYREVGGAICEINASPALRMHASPAEGHPRDVLTPMIESVFPPGRPPRFPCAVILDTDRTAALALAHILKVAGRRVGLAAHGTIHIDAPFPALDGLGSNQAAAALLGDAVIDAAVFLFTAEDLVRHGLGFESAAVAAVRTAQGSAAARILAAGARDLLLCSGLADDAAAFAGASTAAAPVIAVAPGALDAAAALARGMGVAERDVEDGLATFDAVFSGAPGGFRVLREAGRAIVVDLPGGAAEIAALVGLTRRLAAGGCGAAVASLATASERLRVAGVLGGSLDRVIVTTDEEEDQRAGIAGALGSGPGPLLVLARNPERACRYVADALRLGAQPVAMPVARA